MNRIQFDIVAGSEGQAVADLQDGLAFLLEHNAIEMTDAARKKLLAALANERAQQVYKDFTQRAVAQYQKQRGLDATGNIDEKTADRMNADLEDLGGFGGGAGPVADKASTAVVAGHVRNDVGEGYGGLTVRAFHVGGQGFVRLGSDRSDPDGAYSITYGLLPDGQAVDLELDVTDDSGRRLAKSELMPGAASLAVVDLVARRAGPAAQPRRIVGRVSLEHGAPADAVELRLYQVSFAGAATEVARTTSTRSGAFALSYDPGEAAVNLEVRAVDPAGVEVPLSRSLTHMGSEESATIHLIAPSAVQPPAAEYARLTADLLPHVGDVKALAGAREDADRQDLSALNGATGWDARLIALASTAQRLEQQTELAAQGVYGLLRAGLPADPLMLAQLDEKQVGEVIAKGVASGVITMQPADVKAFTARFRTFSRETRMGIAAPGSATTYSELLQGAGVDAADAAFGDVYLSHRGEAAALWDRARESGVSEPTVRKLQLQGKLAFLAGNSGPVVGSLMQALSGPAPAGGGLGPLQAPVELVNQDLYDAAAWKQRVSSLAANNAELDALIPLSYQGDSTDVRLDAYAEDMARKVRLAYPTAVVGRMVQKDAFDLGTSKDAATAVLQAASEQGFTFSKTPIGAFMTNSGLKVAGLSDAEISEGTTQIKTLQRIYQITPSNDAMPVLQRMGLTAAYDITALREDDFYAKFDRAWFDLYQRHPSKAESRLVWRKAQQVSAMTYNLFAVAKKLVTDPLVPSISGSPEQVKTAMAGLNAALKAYPTMESLFGSMDFCECEHCQSVLSPAAYLVDLLQFVEAEPQARANFEADWLDRNGAAYSTKYTAPYDELVRRRPDLANIALTCENTNVALPYIDIVNEILEFYVANGALSVDAANDTGDAESADLLAEPQHVVLKAYETLRADRYPLTVPFDLWLATVREFCRYAEAPLERLTETLREIDDLFDAAKGDRATTFLEGLGITPDERAIVADPDPLKAWWALYGYAAENDALPTLRSAKALARRLGVTYKDLVQLVQVNFVNPGIGALGLLRRVGLEIKEARAFVDVANQGFLTANRDLLGDALDAAQQARIDALSKADWERLTDLGASADRVATYATTFGEAEAAVRARIAATPFDRILVLADPDADCDFDATTLRHADASDANGDVFLRLNLFVRLWRKLGWPMADLDRAFAVLTPSGTPYDEANFAQRPLLSTLIQMAHVRALEERVTVGKAGRNALLTLWSDLPTAGRDSLYARLFLSPAVLRSDPIFDHPAGEYLKADWVAKQGQGKDPAFVLLRGHLPAIRNAVGLTADEVAEILGDSSLGADAALTLENLSILYRYGLLAKGLRLSVHDLITLKALSGLDPFAKLATQPLATLEDDVPFSQTLAFVDVADELRESGLTVATLDFLVRRRFDEAGPLRRDPAATLVLLEGLADGVRAIRTAHAVPTDPGALTEEFLGAKLGLALAPEIAQRVLRMLRGEEELPGLDAFFADHLQRGLIRDAGDTGFLDPADFPDLFEALDAPAAIDVDDDAAEIAAKQAANELLAAANQVELLRRRTRVAGAFLPVLQDRLIRQLGVQALATALGAEPALVESLIADRRLVEVVQPGGGTRTLLAMLASAGELGIDASFFASPAGAGARQATPPHTAAADTALRPARDAGGNALAAANSARFEGYLVAPASGAYRFFVELETSGAKARLRFPHLPEPLLLDGTAAAANAVLGTGAGEFVELKAGVPYRFAFEADGLAGGRARLLVQGETSPRGGIDQLQLYPAAAMDAAYQAWEILASAALLLGSLELDERETRYLLGHRASWGEIDLATFPTQPVGDAAAERASAIKRFDQIRRLTAYRGTRHDMAGDAHGDLLDIFEADATTDPARLVNSVYPLIAKVTRRDVAVVAATSEALWAAPAFGSDVPLARLWQALQLVDRLGTDARSIQGWTRILVDATSQHERFEIARAVKDSVKARFDPETWRSVAQPVFDVLRRRQRDALVAHVMFTDNLERQAQVYELFLLDPGMEPVVQTSRIRLAIGSVQLFVQRCLLNLEGTVHPSAIINADQWEWMKRYRVWEANRKIFLFPENWLEPEFRDEKSHLFADLEGAMLKDDVSPDSVEEAFITYLVGLEELARLDIVAMHLETHPDFGANVLHVFGRTYAQPHKYFYRRYANDMWTPWEPVGADIDGDHLAPVVWRDRLYLFWVTFIESALPKQPLDPINVANPISLPTLVKSVDAYLHWSEYRDGTWSTGESGGYTQPNDLRLHQDVPNDFTTNDVFIHVSVVEDPSEGEETVAGMAEAGVYVHLGAPISKAFHLVSRRASPEAKGAGPAPKNPFAVDGIKKRATRYVGSGNLTVTYSQRISTEPGKSRTEPARILDAADSFTLLPCDNTIGLAVSKAAYEDAERPAEVKAALEASIAEIESLMKPVFFQDSVHTLFVEPDVTERTIEEWQEWVTRTPIPNVDVPGWLHDPDWWEKWVVPAWPKTPFVKDPLGPVSDPPGDWSILVEREGRDWLVNEITGLVFDGKVIGQTGGVAMAITGPGSGQVTSVPAGGSLVKLAAGSEVEAGAFGVVARSDAVASSGLKAVSAGIVVVGGSGFNAAMQEHVENVGAAAMGSKGLMGPGQ